MNCTFGWTTQMSGKLQSVTKLYTRDMMPVNTAACCVINSDANVSPRTIPKYLARSPTSILSAIKFMASNLSVQPARSS